MSYENLGPLSGDQFITIRDLEMTGSNHSQQKKHEMGDRTALLWNCKVILIANSNEITSYIFTYKKTLENT